MITRFRWVAYAEAASLLALLVATFVKRVLEGPDLVSVLGPIHGVLFLIYVVMVLQVRPSQGWGVGKTLLVIIASALPFGGFFVGLHLTDDDEKDAALNQ
jgi:integral membrane protein